MYRRVEKKYRKIRLAQRKTIKKVASETTAVGHSNIPNTRAVSQLVHVCNNACKEIGNAAGLFDANGYSMQLDIPRRWLSLTYLLGSFYISSIRFSLDLFFFLLSPFFSLCSPFARHVFSLHLFSSASKQYCNKAKTREIENRAITILNL